MTVEEILKGESKEIEYKETVPSNSKNYTKTAVAYANCAGGRIVFGVENNTWKVVGVPKDKLFKTADAISNAISDSCEPAINFDILYQTIEGKSIIIVDVLPGNKRPYYLKAEGSKDGVYIRYPGSTKQADEFVVKELEFQGANRCYDQMIAVGKTVTKEQVDALCGEMYQYALKRCKTDEEKRAVKRVEQKNLISWGLLERNGDKLIPTNGFMLLTKNELSAASIQCGVFKGTTRAVFVDRKEYDGPIYKQIDEAFRFVLRNIRVGAEFGDLYRRDSYELPIDSIRELIVNAVAHRSYLDPAKVQVAIYDDRLEVTSPGMLIGGVTLQELKNGCSKPRNRGIVNAFAYMKNMDEWGSGIPRLYDDCFKAGLREPELIEFGGSFRVNVYRKTELALSVNENLSPESGDKKVAIKSGDKKVTIKSGDKITPKMQEKFKLVLSAMEPDTMYQADEFCDVLNVKISRTRAILKEMVELGLIESLGANRDRRYMRK